MISSNIKKELLLPNDSIEGVPIHKRYNEKIVDKEVEIDAKEWVGSFRGSHFMNCIVKIRCSAKYTFTMTSGCSFENCLIWARTKQSGGNWNAHFKDCSFKGRFELRFENKLLNCDFSNSKNSYIGLLSNNDLKEIAGIAYPVIAIIDPKKNYLEWDQIPKPKDYNDLVWAAKHCSGMLIINILECTNESDILWNNIKDLAFVKTNVDAHSNK